MKHIKKFEGSWYNKPDYIAPIAEYLQIGDYVICKEGYNLDLNTFLSTHIGQVVSNKVSERVGDGADYMIQYNYWEIPKNIREFFQWKKHKKNCRGMNKSEIVHFSKNKKDLEIFIDIKKYNL